MYVLIPYIPPVIIAVFGDTAFVANFRWVTKVCLEQLGKRVEQRVRRAMMGYDNNGCRSQLLNP